MAIRASIPTVFAKELDYSAATLAVGDVAGVNGGIAYKRVCSIYAFFNSIIRLFRCAADD